MPSPFPGMDPFIERFDWEDFHVRFTTAIADALTPYVRPKYVVRAERRVYLEHPSDSERERLRPDVAVLRSGGPTAARPGAGEVQGTSGSPLIVTLPMPEEHREAFLTIRLIETLDVVTVIEVLSPTNKRRGSDGQREYLAKRETVLTSGTHLVELDFLRGGERMPTLEPLPPGDFFALVCRGNRRPRAEVYAWTLRDRMPTAPVPLAKQDPDVPLDLQAVFDVVYDRAGYDYSLPYAAPAHPPLSSADAGWAADLLRRAGRTT